MTLEELNNITEPCTIHSVRESDYFTLSEKKGYCLSQRREAMQVMECWNKVMTVKCKNGCMTKPYDEFEKITDVSKLDYFRNVNKYPYEMEDIRTHSL